MDEETRESVTSAIAGRRNPLRNVEQKTDGEYADEVFRKHEKSIDISRKESYVSARNLLLKQQEASGKKEIEWDKLTVEQLSEALSSSPEHGLTASEAKARYEKYGANELNKPKRPSFAMLFLLQLLNFMILLLCVATVASLIVSATGPDNTDPLAYVDSIAIFAIVVINAGIGAITENSAAGALEALSKLSQPKATVLRDGKEMQIPSVKITKGDVLILAVGDIVPADVRLIEAHDFKVNEMLLTGEPDDVAKFARMKKKKESTGKGGHDEGEKLTPENMAFSSCMCTSGKSRAFVVEIGMSTRVGRIAKLLAEGDGSKKKRKSCIPDIHANQTPLQQSLMHLGVKVGIFSVVVCIIVFIVGASLGVYDVSKPLRDSVEDSLLYMVLIAVTLAVAAIPEGIPICVTISLATGCSDMVKQKVLVRRLAAVETLGCASVICTDKTGTLTEGKMSMVKMWAAGIDYDVSGKGFDPTAGKITYHKDNADAKDSEGVVQTLTSASLCCNTKIVLEVDPDDGTKKWLPHGNSSEAPIIVAAGKIGKKPDELEEKMPRIFEVPFSSSRKMMLTVVELSDKNGSNEYSKKTFPGLFKKQTPKYLANVKGAPNFIMKDCDSWLQPDGSVAPLDQAQKDIIMKRVDELSSEALRVLAVAARPVVQMPFDHTDKDLEMSADDKFVSLVKQPGLILFGLVASIDPERDGVPQAVLDAQGGHIRVVMITGDYLPTAIAIGYNVNILHKDDDIDSAALDCGKLRPTGDYLPDPEIDLLTKTVKCFARAQPEDKLQIVKSLQRQGLVCAMTGDGVNDAPALKRADIGVAMGLQGTEVAKGASDMILTDDNFCSIVGAVEKGRLIYAGIQKFVAFIMSVHIAEVSQIFLCIISGLPVMRTPLQILFLILVTDLPPSVALGMERVARDILKDRPRSKEQPVVLFWQWQGIVASAIVLIITTMAVYVWALDYFLYSRFTVDQLSREFCGGIDCDDFRHRYTSDSEAEKHLNKHLIHKLVLARTTAFMSLVFSDNIRAYTARSFDKLVFIDMCTNPAMQKAIFFAQAGCYLAVFVPGLNDEILEFDGRGMGWEGWVAAILGGCATVTMCELYKIGTKQQIIKANQRVADEMERRDMEREKLIQERIQELKAIKLKEQAMAANGNGIKNGNGAAPQDNTAGNGNGVTKA